MPYRGYFDFLTTRSLSTGTNEDHTAIIISTAGSQGMLNLIPVFLDYRFNILGYWI